MGSGSNTLGRGRYTMDKGFKMPWIRGQSIMDTGSDIPWINGFTYHKEEVGPENIGRC